MSMDYSCCPTGFEKNYLTFLYNPGTRKIFKLPAVSCFSKGLMHDCYMLGFDESSNVHKILNIRTIVERTQSILDRTQLKQRLVVHVFSLSDYSWRKIDLDSPFDPMVDPMVDELHHGWKTSVCVDSVIHLMLYGINKILCFDLRTEKFSFMSLPLCKDPFIKMINGFLGVVSREGIDDGTEMGIWTLEDYANQVWVKNTITLPDAVFTNFGPYPRGTIHNNELWFCPRRVSHDLLSIAIYDMKKKTFRWATISLSQLLQPKRLVCVDIWCYAEKLMPLKNSVELLHLISSCRMDS